MRLKNWFRSVPFKLRFLFRRRQADLDLNEELLDHLDRKTQAYIAAGLGPQQARRQALIDLRGFEQTKENCRDARRAHFVDASIQDMRFALRMLSKSPGFTTVAILTLALGIGANTAIFSAVYGLLLKPLPYPHSSQLLDIMTEKTSGSAGSQLGLIMPVSTGTAHDIETESQVFEAFSNFESGQSFTLTGQSVPEILNVASVDGRFFSFAGVPPLLGRAIVPADTTAGNSDVVVLSYHVWKALLGGDPHWIGRRITLNSKLYTVIGVMPPKFDMEVNPDNGIWVPRIPAPGEATKRDSSFVGLLARLRPGVSQAAVQAELKTLSNRLAAAYPKTDAGWTLQARGLEDLMHSQIDEGLFLLLGASGLVLLIACVNVSGLLLARGWDRHKEVAIRTALGAARFRIVCQFLSESLLLSLAGGAFGLLLAPWVTAGLRVFAQPYTSSSRLDDMTLNLPVLGFALGVTLLAGIFLGLVPALQVSARHIGAALKESLSGSVGGFSARRPRKLRGTLVVVEVALAVILVIGATLFARSFAKITSVKLGFRTDHILTLAVNFSKAVCDPDNQKSTTQCALAVTDLLARVKSLPGVQNAAVTSGLPGRGARVGMDLRIEGHKEKIGFGAGSAVFQRIISAGFFEATGMRILEGRSFTPNDVSGSQLVAIVNESFAKTFLSGQPLGKRISEEDDKSGQPQWMVIVGEVNDSHDWDVTGKSFPEFYTSFLQDVEDSPLPDLIVRTAADPMSMAAAVKQQVWAVDRDAPVTAIATLDQVISDEVAQPRFQALLLGSFGALGLILALVGIYGVISYNVTQRTREIGLRLALGAQPETVLRMVIREGMFIAVMGIILGIGGTLAFSRVLNSLLFEIKPYDPATFVAVSIAIAAVALAACYIPARRVMKVDPMVALRYE
ncbi:MAG TPA: ABC transporter permease [Candidatus Acidoferrales bacterium]|nr:ABC transporter permease [Candidatus Acidoferrales bacterium]